MISSQADRLEKTREVYIRAFLKIDYYSLTNKNGIADSFIIRKKSQENLM
jgi:hypothetical protein